MDAEVDNCGSTPLKAPRHAGWAPSWWGIAVWVAVCVGFVAIHAISFTLTGGSQQSSLRSAYRGWPAYEGFDASVLILVDVTPARAPGQPPELFQQVELF